MYLGATTEKEKEMKARRNNQTQLNTKVKAINNIVKQLHMLATSSYQKSYSELINDQSKDISYYNVQERII